jgi:ATP-dependent RNA helicase DDX27
LYKVVEEIQCEVEQEKEMADAMKEIKRSENMIKYKDEIKNRPRKEWIMGKKQRENIAKESKKDLKNLKNKLIK